MINPIANSKIRGFSLVEALIALVVFLAVLAIVFSFFVDFGKNANTQAGFLDQQTAARISVDDVARAIQMCGYNIVRDPSDDPSTWQKDVVYGGSHAFACNADVDAAIGPISPSVTITFPTGDTYVGQGPPAATGGAETYVFTIDANDDGAVTLADRSAAATGSYNPAADTPNPLDFALFKKTYGYNGTDYGGALIPITGGLFTNATSAVDYPDTTSPEPVFTYWLTEDIDRSGSLEDKECAVGTCPSARLPKLYLWGDTDGNGTLSETEKDNVRDKPVGSAAWTKNPFVTGGNYNSSTLTAAIDPASATPYVLTLASVDKFSPGMYIQVDTSTSTEYAVVESVVASSKTVALNAELHKAHSVGATVRVMPQTLMRAVRAVRIQFDSISPKADLASGGQAAGRAARAGSKGLDYQVRQYDKTVELTNLTTEPLETASSAATACPLTARAVCDGADVTTVRAYFPSSTPTPLDFTVVDTNGTPVSGVTVTFTKTNSVGTLSSATANSDSFGEADSGYSATALGDSTVTAQGTCIDGFYNAISYSDTILVKGTQLIATMTNDCLSTVSSRTTAPSTSFTVKAQDSAGAVPNTSVSLSLQFDTSVLPSTPDYNQIQATLYVGGSPVGSTDATGAFPTWTGSTGGSGILSGAVVLNTDTLGKGARVNLVARAAPDTCWPASANLSQAVTYLRLELASANPSGCTESSPCLLAAGADAPNVVGTLSINNVPIPGATVTFSKTDFHPAPDTPAAASLLQPAAAATTDSSGVASVYVANNGSASITAGNPLATTVDAAPSGLGYCTTPSIVPVSEKAKFLYQGSASAGKCDADMQQAWVSSLANDKKCMHALNPNVANACPLRPTGIKIAVYTSGVLDAQYLVKSIKGGNTPAVGTTCSTGGNSKQLFKDKCNPLGQANLSNNTRFDFVDTADCDLPPNAATPGQYFSLDEIQFSKALPAGLRVDVTLYYGCDGALCSTSPAKSETWILTTP